MYGTFFMLIWCSCIRTGLMQTTSWDLDTPLPVFFKKPAELRCTINSGLAPCCTSLTRTWIKGSSQIMSNGVSSPPSKYSETLDAANNQFILIINELEPDDVDVIYTCTYGSTAIQKTLTQNISFEYLPSGSCPVTIDNGELVGTLNVAMSAPYPSISAQYGGKNFTSYLTTTITPVTGRPKFYSIKSYIKAKATCCNDEKFTLSVLTGVTTTNICDNVDLCKHGKCECAGKCFGWAVLGTTVVTVFIILILFIPKEKKKNPPSSEPVPVYGGKGSTVTFKCPFKGTQSTRVRWSYVNKTGTDAVTISDGQNIASTNPSHDRVSIVGKHEAGQYHLQLFGLQKSDEGVYRCNVGLQQKEFILELKDKTQDVQPEGGKAIIKKKKMLSVVMIFGISVILDVIVAVPICYILCICFEDTDPAFIVLGVGTCVIVAVIVLCCMPGVHPCYTLPVVCFLTCGLVLLCKKPDMNPDDAEQMQLATHASGSGTSSSNSGLFSWASCKVDQEPVNPSKNSAPPKGKNTKTPTNEKDKKPEVNTKHIKTENREKETSFADDKDFESNLNKVPKGRLLPLLNDTATPRALPPKPDTLPPIPGRKLPELNDLDETAPEKKKKKKKKKMQDDDEL